MKKGLTITWTDYVFKSSDFIASDEISLKSHFLADLKAFILPSSDEISVEITGITLESGVDVSGSLKRDPEHLLVREMRSYYLAWARRGLEGDTFCG